MWQNNSIHIFCIWVRIEFCLAANSRNLNLFEWNVEVDKDFARHSLKWNYANTYCKDYILTLNPLEMDDGPTNSKQYIC